MFFFLLDVLPYIHAASPRPILTKYIAIPILHRVPFSPTPVPPAITVPGLDYLRLALYCGSLLYCVCVIPLPLPWHPDLLPYPLSYSYIHTFTKCKIYFPTPLVIYSAFYYNTSLSPGLRWPLDSLLHSSLVLVPCLSPPKPPSSRM